MERKYGSNEEALNVAKEVIYLAWVAAGGPQGSGFLQDRGPQPKDKVWDQAYTRGDYPGGRHHEAPESVDADYVFGRMLKLRFSINGKSITEISDSIPRGDYQSWCFKYPTYAALFDAAETEVLKQAA